MDVSDIQRELEHVESAVEKNTDQKLVHGLIAKGIWQVALQLAHLNYHIRNIGADIRS